MPAHTRRSLPGAILAGMLLCGWPLVSQGQNASEVADKKEDLKELRGRIESLRKELSASEESRADAADQLKQIEREISQGERKLLNLKRDQTRLQNTLADMARQSRELESTLAQQQGQLEKLLYRQYLQGSPDALQLLLNGDDPNQLARDLYYLSTIAHSRTELLSDVRSTLKKQKTLAAEARSRAAELAEVEAAQKTQQAELLQQRAERQTILNQIASKVKAQKKEIGNLQRDEKRLSNLVDRLTRLLAERARRPAPPPRPAPGGKAPPENRHLPTASRGDFARLQGQLRLPARGQVVGRFGAPREGGSTWKGLFIRAGEGSEVKAVANGQVVYAEWMRGFGNLMIIDHGDGYLTVYGNNDSLLKQVGDRVQGGETVSTVGNSGGNQNSGLYFELRHQGKALDPMKWVSLK
ncbi:MAG: peptidoglycan DD-metalloendopeptidase family protein [Azovibrio sp.]|uniref:murein hydrolase activator EnvC family protein n=1 Tax=Azovibrio sp. TaxID=1872673 RepID=UPI003C7570BE